MNNLWNPTGFPIVLRELACGDIHTFKHAKYYLKSKSDNSYHDLLEELKGFLGADCTAFVVTTPVADKYRIDKFIRATQIMWDYFHESKSLLETVDESVRRDHIIDDPHSLFVHVIRRKKSVEFNIYMMGGDRVNNESLVIIYGKYDPTEETFNFVFRKN